MWNDFGYVTSFHVHYFDAAGNLRDLGTTNRLFLHVCPGDLVRWSHTIVFAVLLGFGTGCPRDWTPDGTLDRAARKDTRERLKDVGNCAPGESWEEVCVDDAEEGKVCSMECL